MNNVIVVACFGSFFNLIVSTGAVNKSHFGISYAPYCKNLLLISGRVMEAVKLLSERVMPNFAEKVEANVQILSSGQEISQEDQNEFIDAARLVYEGVREIRRAVLLNRVGPNF